MPKDTPLVQRQLISVDFKYTFPKAQFELLHALCGSPTGTIMEHLLFNELASLNPNVTAVTMLPIYRIICVSVYNQRTGNSSYVMTSLDIQIWFNKLLQP